MVDRELELQQALKQAARRLGQSVPRPAPLDALRAAIREYRALFRADQTGLLQTQRRLAQEAMKEFAAFRPQLTGALLHGDGPLDQVRLLLYADTPELVMHHLSDRHIPWEDAETVLHYSGGRRTAHPSLRFIAGESTIELVILEPRSRSDPPRDPLSGRALEMLGAEQLDALIKS